MDFSFRSFVEDTQSVYDAAKDELNTGNEVPVQVFGWIGPFTSDNLYRFGQSFIVTKNDENEDVIWVKPASGKDHYDSKEKSPAIQLNVMKCAQKHPDTGEWMRVECPVLRDTKAFPIKRKVWNNLVNQPFQNMQQGGMGGMMGGGGLPGMM
jgi:hypothetical protein